MFSVYQNKLNREEYKKLNKMIDTGFKKAAPIGEGGYARVYALSEGKAVRVEEGSKCSGYSEYVEKIVLQKKSKYLPKVFFHATSPSHNIATITVLERLHPLDEDLALEIEEEYLHAERGEIPTKIRRGINKIIKMGSEVGLFMEDIHSGNVMCRKNGDVVLTDPVA